MRSRSAETAGEGGDGSGSESLRPWTEAESEATKPRKWRPWVEAWKQRAMSSGEEMRLAGAWKAKGGAAGGTGRGCGTGERTMAAVLVGALMAGMRMGR